WAEEFLFFDSFSTDRRVKCARSVPKPRFLQHEYSGKGPQCNGAMARAAGPWILIVDADERVPAELAREIERLLEKSPAADQYLLKRRNFFLGREIRGSGWGRDRLVGLLAHGSGPHPGRR